MLYQIWQFIAAGLYPKERKYVTKYLPLSITLLIGGMLFLYFYVLPLMLEFFLAFNIGPSFKSHHPLSAHAERRPPSRLCDPDDQRRPEGPGARRRCGSSRQTGLLKICPGNGTRSACIAFGSRAW